MKKQITKLTQEQIDRIPEWVDKWIQIGLSTEPADFDAAIDAGLKIYDACGLDRPQVVLRARSPIECVYAGEFASALFSTKTKDQVAEQVWDQVGDQVGSKVADQVAEQVWIQAEDQVRSKVKDRVADQVWIQVEDQVRSKVEGQVADQVAEQVWEQVEDQVEAQVADQVKDQVADQVGDQVGSQVLEQVEDKVRCKSFYRHYRGGNLWSYGPAYVSFFRDVCGYKDEALESFALDEILTKSAGWTYWKRNVFVVSDRPSAIHLDEEGRLHCETGPAIQYRDGWGVYAFRGTRIPAEWIEAPEKLTAQVALSWENIEQRRAACELLGWHKILDELNAKSIDKHDNPQVGELVEVQLPDLDRPSRYLRVRCGTGRDFAVGVPNDVTTALGAQAWLTGLPESLFVLPPVRS